jgi:hypothetical protein
MWEDTWTYMYEMTGFSHQIWPQLNKRLHEQLLNM